MGQFKFGTCEFCFPVWGAYAMETDRKAGFEGMQITDGGGYLQPHPQNNGFVEYERFGLDLRRKDSFPLTHRWVQEEYLEAAARYDIQLTGIYLYLLDHQGFVKFSSKTLQGQQCLESIRNAIVAASQMQIPLVSIPINGMFGVGQHAYALEKLQYAAEVAEAYGVQVATSTDTSLSRQIEVLDLLQGKVKLDFNTIDPTLYARGHAPDLMRALGKERIAQFRVQDMSAGEEGFVTKEDGGMAPLGQGNANFQECAQAIKETGYTGWVLSETAYYSANLNRDGADDLSLARQDVATLEKAFNGKSWRDGNGEV